MSGLLDDPWNPDAGRVVLLGSGAIGSSVAKGVARQGKSRYQQVRIPWDSDRRIDVLDRLLKALPSTDESKNSIIWAAGRAGFSAAELDCDHEFAAFRDVLEAIERLMTKRSSGSTSFHMVSSAGGLFEGLTRVSVDSPPQPRRPYGRLKIAEELKAMELSSSLPVVVYRVSSVYGCPTPGHRSGLITELIRNGFKRRPTSLYGAMDTLRDYVSSEEVGYHIARRLAERQEIGGHIQMLVAGRPTPIAAVIGIVERALRRRLLVSFQQAWNAKDITFDPAVSAEGFESEALSTGVSKVVSEFLGSPASVTSNRPR